MNASPLIFSVPGPPKGKQRARTGKGFAFTPKQTVRFENYVKYCFSQAYPGHTPHEGPVRMKVVGFFPISQSKPKWWKGLCEGIENDSGAVSGVPFISSPDWDNLGKIVSDALNGIAYKDDRLVFSCLTEQFYSPRPRIDIEIELLPVVTKDNPATVPLS